MPSIYIVQADHWAVPGRKMSAHATAAGANVAAAEMTNQLLENAGLVRGATPKTWSKHLEFIGARLDRDGIYDFDTGEPADFDVWITQLQLED